MRAYLYFTWEEAGVTSGFMILKQAMLHDISKHIYQLGQKGFLFLTDKGHEQVMRSIRERRDRPFILVDVTDGLNDHKFKTNIDLDGLRSTFIDGRQNLALDPILEKVFQHGYASLSSEERDYLDAKSNETQDN